MQSQKQLIILIVVTASLTSFLAGYLLTQGSRNTDLVIQQQRGVLIDRFNGVTESTTPTPLPPGLLQASPDTTLAAVSAADADAVLYYHPDSGFVSRLDLETRTNTVISTASLTKLIRVIWSPDKNRVITVSRSSTGSVYAYFDYTSHEHGSLGVNIEDAAFSPDSSQIALVRNGGGDSSIQIADFDGKNPREIFKTHLDNTKLAWPAPHTLAFTASDAGAATQSLYALSDTGDLTQLVGGADTLASRWSPDGSKLLYSDLESGAVVLHVLDMASQQSQTLPVSTAATACAWPLDQKSITCAVQTEGETAIHKISLADNTDTILFSHLIITSQDVFLSHLEGFLVIISTTDQSIWEVKLSN